MRSRAVKPRCSKSLSLGFPEVIPKTARHAGCLFQGKTGFCTVRLWLPSSRHPFALCALAGSVCWLCACLRAVTMRHAAALCATAICVPLRFACAAPAGEGRCGQSTCDIRDYAARSLPIAPGFRHGSPPLAFDNALKGRRVSAHRFGHPHQQLAVKTLRIHVAKVSLSNRPLFE